MLVEISDLLSPVELHRCREALKAATWRDGRLTAGHVALDAKNNQQLAADDPLAVQIGDLILERLGRSDRFMTTALPLKVLPPRLNRYAGGGSYGDHIDNAVFSVPGTPHRIRSDLSATLFFSDPDEYEGGELIVTSPEGSREFKLPAGHMLLYSSGSLHRVNPVTRGERLAAFFWVQSLVREESQRALLLELDETIQELKKETASAASLLRLTGLYHNLLRHWVDT